MVIVSAPESGQPIPAHVAAVWGGFIYEGLLAPSLTEQRLEPILDAWGCGCIELVMASCHHLDELWSQVSTRWDKEDTDFPGVFEYSVVSSLGKYLGDYLLEHEGRLPSPEQVKQQITTLINHFFQLEPLTAL